MIGLTILPATALSSFFIVSNMTGFLLEKTEDAGYISLALAGLLYPLGMLFIANFNERAKLAAITITASMAVVSSYFVMLGVPNFRIPAFEVDLTTLTMYFLSMASSMALAVISISDLLSKARGLEERVTVFSVAFLAAGGITAIGISLGSLGWLIPIMFSDYLVPGGLLVHVILRSSIKVDYPNIEVIHKPARIKKYWIKERNKAFKLTVYTIISSLQIALLLGVNGLALDPEVYYGDTWLLWLFIGAGCLITGMLVVPRLFKNHEEEFSKEKIIKSNISWLMISILQSSFFFVIVTLNLNVPTYHGSIVAFMVDGAVLGFMLMVFWHIVMVQHPPKSMRLFLMLMSFFLCISFIAGTYLKSLTSVSLSDFEEIMDYAIYLYLAFVVALVILVIAFLVTIKKHGKKGASRTITPKASM